MMSVVDRTQVHAGRPAIRGRCAVGHHRATAPSSTAPAPAPGRKTLPRPRPRPRPQHRDFSGAGTDGRKTA